MQYESSLSVSAIRLTGEEHRVERTLLVFSLKWQFFFLVFSQRAHVGVCLGQPYPFQHIFPCRNAAWPTVISSSTASRPAPSHPSPQSLLPRRPPLRPRPLGLQVLRLQVRLYVLQFVISIHLTDHSPSPFVSTLWHSRTIIIRATVIAEYGLLVIVTSDWDLWRKTINHRS